MTAVGLLVLRLALAVVFAAHGAHMLFGVWASPGAGPGGISQSAALYASLGIEPATLLAVLAGLTQLVGGVLLGIGWFARWSAAALGIYVGVGIWKVHAHWGFFLNWMGVSGRREGLEYSIVLAGAIACLFLIGPGSLSIDGRRTTRAASRAAGRARLRGQV